MYYLWNGDWSNLVSKYSYFLTLFIIPLRLFSFGAKFFWFCQNSKICKCTEYEPIYMTGYEQPFRLNWESCMNLPSSYAYEKMHIDIITEIIIWVTPLIFGTCILHGYKVQKLYLHYTFLFIVRRHFLSNWQDSCTQMLCVLKMCL